MQSSLLRSVLFVALAAGCAGSGQLTYATTATMPDLVVISPGVQVIADQDVPIFYSQNYYWRNAGGFWYRSPEHTRGWIRVKVAPAAIRKIDRPSAYVRYRGQAGASVGTDRRVHAPTPQVRDDRDRRDGHDGNDGRDRRDGHDGNDGRDGKDKHDGHDGKDKRDGHDGRDKKGN